jgi:chromate transport protein ChrA
MENNMNKDKKKLALILIGSFLAICVIVAFVPAFLIFFAVFFALAAVQLLLRKRRKNKS